MEKAAGLTGSMSPCAIGLTPEKPHLLRNVDDRRNDVRPRPVDMVGQRAAPLVHLRISGILLLDRALLVCCDGRARCEVHEKEMRIWHNKSALARLPYHTQRHVA